MSSFDWNVIGGGGTGDAPAGPQKISFLCKDTTVDDNISDNVPVIGPVIGRGSILERILATWRVKKDSSPSDLTVRFRLKYLAGEEHTIGMFTLPSSTALATTLQFTTFDWPTFPDRAVVLTDVTSSDGFKSANGVASFVLVYAGRGTGLPTALGMGTGGTYNSGTTYVTGDVVESGGNAYVSRTDDNTGNDPATNPDDWGLIATGGAPGADGAPGVGVPTGGDTGQVLAKQSGTDYDTEWVDAITGVPTGGVAADMLVKQSSTDFDTAWAPAPRSFPPETNKFLTGWADLTGEFSAEQPTEANLSLSDITTNDVTTGRHGLVPKLTGDATKYLDSTGAWSEPAGTGSVPPTVIYDLLTDSDGNLIYTTGGDVIVVGRTL